MKKCVACDSITTYITKYGYSHWHNHDNSRLCQKCYFRYVLNPVRNPKRIMFNGKWILLDHNPRKGICLKCKKSIANNEIKKTDMHHKKYDKANPLRYTVELCVSCHDKLRRHRDI